MSPVSLVSSDSPVSSASSDSPVSLSHLPHRSTNTESILVQCQHRFLVVAYTLSLPRVDDCYYALDGTDSPYGLYCQRAVSESNANRGKVCMGGQWEGGGRQASKSARRRPWRAFDSRRLIERSQAVAKLLGGTGGYLHELFFTILLVSMRAGLRV